MQVKRGLEAGSPVAIVVLRVGDEEWPADLR